MSSVVRLAIWGFAAGVILWALMSWIADPTKNVTPASPGADASTLGTLQQSGRERPTLPGEKVQREAPGDEHSSLSAVEGGEAAANPTLAPPFSQEAFELCYETFGLEELLQARKELESKLEAATTEAITLQYESGFFSRHPFEWDADGVLRPPTETVTVPENQRDLLKQYVRAADVNEWHLVAAPRDTFQDLYGLLDERAWVLRRITELRREQTRRY